jgi:hypothetical protein
MDRVQRWLLEEYPTIMAGLLIKELIVRGDLQRCLIVGPGSLAEQWHDELYRRFQLPFEILTNDKLEAARTCNWFLETNLVIARLGKLSRNEDVQQKLQTPDCRWDLVVCDEAQKMSATVFSGETKYTKRYRLGQLLSTLTRHWVSAVPVDTQASAARARAIVIEIERSLGFEPTDREFEKLGYDVESSIPGTGKLCFIEVKGRVTGAPTITVTRNEILYSLNKPDDFILAIVEFLDGDSHRVHYVRQPFQREPDVGVTSVNYNFADLLARAKEPF